MGSATAPKFTHGNNASSPVREPFKSSNPDHYTEIGVTEYNDPRLYIDPDIQRGEVNREIKDFCADFEPMALGIITISVRTVGRDEVWSVVDGQQRLATVRKLEYKEPLKTEFHYGLSKAEEARLFLRLNKREGVPAINQFNSRITAGDPAAMTIARVLDDLGIRIGGQKGFTAVRAADEIVALPDGARHLQWALNLIKQVYDPDGKGGCYNGDVVKAFALLSIHRAELIDVEKLVAKLSGRGGGIHNLIGSGRTLKQMVAGSISESIADAILNVYNDGKRLNPQFPSRVAFIPRTKKTVKTR